MKEIPTQTEVSLRLGLPLAETLFIYDHNEIKKLLGLLSPLKSVSGELWISPSAQINNNKVLSLPENNNIIKECTHLGILALGKDLLNKFKIEIKSNIRKEFKNQLIDEKYLCEAEKRHCIKINIQKIHALWQKYLNTIEYDMHTKLQIEFTKVILKCNKEIQKAVTQERINITQNMLNKVHTKISCMVVNLYKEFEQTHKLHMKNIIKDVNEILRKERIKNKEKIEKLKKEKTESLNTQKIKLETKNITNIMYLLCLEKLHSNLEKQKIQNHFERKVCNLQNVISNLKKMLNTAEETIETYQCDNKLLKKKFDNINQEFHKFVAFVFNTVPKQAEFVLPLESIYLQQMNETK